MDTTYHYEGVFLIPNLTTKTNSEVTLGKYAYLRCKYLREHRKVLYINLLTSGDLTEHLWVNEQTAMERIETVTKMIAVNEGVTEELKANDPMKWIGLMNSIRSAAEETILEELIYV